MSADGEDGGPVLRVVRGNPDDEELVALVAVLTARAAAARRVAAEAAARTAPRSAWADRARGLRRPLPRGPGAWRRSGR